MIAWAVVGVCWAWLFRSSRRRAALMAEMAREYSGFLRKRFFLPSFSLEPVELSWTRVVSGQPVIMVFRYELPLSGFSRLPQTVFEMEARDAVFGLEGGTYLGNELNVGRGLFMGGVNLTEEFRKFALETPQASRFRLGWKGSRAWMAVPGLLDTREEFWVRHCIRFMEETAGRISGVTTA